MTSRRAQRRQKCAAEMAVLVCWCAAESDLPEARQTSHDALIRMLGPRRRGGVTWSWWTGEVAADKLDELGHGVTGALAEHYRHLRGMLREYGGYIVAASAPGVRS